MKKLIFLIILLALPIQVLGAQNITNPQVVSSMRVSIVEEGSIETTGAVYNLNLNLSIPQQTEYQDVEDLKVEDSSGLCNNALCSYDFVYDDYGNRLLRIKWTNPPEKVEYKVSSTVSVRRRSEIEKRMVKEFIEPTDLVESADPLIVELSSSARGSDFEKISYLAKWIGENIEYDKVFSDVSLSATEILELRKGVCKEFSNLLVSLARNLGYYSAVTVGYVHPGRVYDTYEFQPHGWAEVYADGGIVVDPVWSEVGYLDATHVKFATLPDSSWTFTSASANGLGDIRIKINDNKVTLGILSFREDPLIDTKTTLLANNVWSNYSVLRTDLSTEGCVLTKIEYKSCIDSSGRDFLQIVDPQNVVYFCGNRSVFTIFRIPSLDDRKSYRCDIKIFPYAGTETIEQLVLNPKGYGYSKLAVENSVLRPGEKFTATAIDSQIFTDYGAYGYEKVQFTAPNYDFKIYSYNSGYLDSKDISVVLQKPIDVFLDVNDSVDVGSQIQVRLRVVNLERAPQNLKAIFKDQSVSSVLEDEQDFVFNFTPMTVNDNLVQVFVSTPDFSTSASKVVKVRDTESIAGDIFKTISDFFSWLLSLFGVSL